MSTLSLNSNIIGISYGQMNNIKTNLKRAEQMLQSSQNYVSSARGKVQVDRSSSRLRLSDEQLSSIYSEENRRKSRIDKVCNNIDYIIRRFQDVDSRCARSIKDIGKSYNLEKSLFDKLKSGAKAIGNDFKNLIDSGIEAFEYLGGKFMDGLGAIGKWMDEHPIIANTLGILGNIAQLAGYIALLTPPFTVIGVIGIAFSAAALIDSTVKLGNNLINGTNDGFNPLEKIFEGLGGKTGKDIFNVLDIGVGIGGLFTGGLIGKAGKVGEVEKVVEEVSNPELSRIDYLRSKFGKMTSEELHNEINRKELRRIIGNESPAKVAQNWQGGDPYFGVDDYKNIKLKPGKVIYAGEPKPTGYLTTKSGIDRVGNDATKIFEGLQVKPFYKEGMDSAIYRNTMMAYEPTIELDGAFGIAKANPQFGKGKLPQIYIDNFNELVHNGYLKKLPEKAIELQNYKISYEDYEKIADRIIELGGKGY